MGEVGDPKALISRRFWHYLARVFHFPRLIDRLGDSRQSPQVSTRSCFLAVFFLFVLGERSLNSLEGRLRFGRRGGWWKRLFRSRAPSADTIGYAFSRFDVGALRTVIHHIYTVLQRNHIIRRFCVGGLRALALDGHELFASYSRHCPTCCTRSVSTAQGPRTQYYHRVVVAQLVSGPLALPLDVEPIVPGEDELAASLRLLQRILRSYPRAFDVLTGDALYANPEVLGLLRHRGKHLLAVLKQNHPDLLEDATALFADEPCLWRGSEGRVEFERWDIEGFPSWWQVGQDIRVVRSRETKTPPGRGTITVSDWFWLTTMETAFASTQTVCSLGHARWDIENQGFNYLSEFLNLDHCFHHHPTAIVAFLLVSFIAYILLQAFYRFNLKPARRRLITLQGLMGELSVAFWSSMDQTIRRAKPP